MKRPTPVSLAGALERLSIGITKTTIRRGHTHRRGRIIHPEKTGFEASWGEQIWIWCHMMDNLCVYSHTKVLTSNKALAQIPFNGKKLKPAKLRRDYWRPMACIQFPKGLGVVGRNVFQKLREYRQLHELSWGYQAKEFLTISRHERGKALNDQKANTVADMAAVLAGAGRGNLMWISQTEGQTLEGRRVVGAIDEKPVEEHTPTAYEQFLESKMDPRGRLADTTIKLLKEDEQNAAQDDEEDIALQANATISRYAKEGDPALLNATIYWMNELDAAYAKQWTPNVKHRSGFPKVDSRGHSTDSVANKETFNSKSYAENVRLGLWQPDEVAIFGAAGRYRKKMEENRPGNIKGRKLLRHAGNIQRTRDKKHAELLGFYGGEKPATTGSEVRV